MKSNEYRGWIEIHKWKNARFRLSIRNGGKNRMVVKIGYYAWVVMWGDCPKGVTK